MQTSNQRTQNNNFPLTRLNPFGTFLSESLPHSGQHAPRAFSPPCLLETWSPCSRPLAILSVSAVSDAQKLATGNFLHVRAALSLLLPQQFLPLRGFLRRLAAASFGGKAAKSRAPNGARLFIPPGYSRLSAELRRIFRVLVLSNSR